MCMWVKEHRNFADTYAKNGNVTSHPPPFRPAIAMLCIIDTRKNYFYIDTCSQMYVWVCLHNKYVCVHVVVMSFTTKLHHIRRLINYKNSNKWLSLRRNLEGRIVWIYMYMTTAKNYKTVVKQEIVILQVFNQKSQTNLGSFLE